MQREMPFYSSLKAPKDVDESLIRMCNSKRQAYLLCVQMSGLTQEKVGMLLGIDKGNFSKMMGGARAFPGDRELDLMWICGNNAPRQYDDFDSQMRQGKKSDESHAARLERENREMMIELAAIKSQKAA